MQLTNGGQATRAGGGREALVVQARQIGLDVVPGRGFERRAVCGQRRAVVDKVAGVSEHRVIRGAALGAHGLQKGVDQTGVHHETFAALSGRLATQFS